MRITFLSSKAPLTKTITSTSSDPYPKVRELTSHAEDVTTIEEWFEAIKTHGSKYHALLKGNLAHPIVNESRANLHDVDALTSWAVLDFDGIENMSIDTMLHALGIGDIDHIVQYSASSGFKPGLRCHVFFLLNTPRLPAELKRWMQKLNLTIPELQTMVKLNKNGLALRWPLDICVADNSRIIYIAPPILDKITPDPYSTTPRYVLNKRTQRTLDIGVVPQIPQIRAMTDKKITELQPEGFVGRIRTRWVDMEDSSDSFAIPAHYATVTATKEGHDFIYLNLNGGDSWAYYHHKENPVFLYNFKGEPIYRLVDIVPRYAKRLIKQQGVSLDAFIDVETEEFVLIRDGSVLRFRTKDACRATANKYNFPIEDFAMLAPIRFVFDPTLPSGIQDDSASDMKVYNTFTMPEQPAPLPGASWQSIEFLIRHLCVDTPTYEHFINWLAYIFQTHKKSRTAWIFCGVQGTGKGTLFNNIITPLAGTQNVVVITTSDLEANYNNYILSSLFMLYDEASYNPNKSTTSIENKLKHLITEPLVRLSEKYVRARVVPSYTNVIITSNSNAIIRLDPSDRRYNITPRQEVALSSVCDTYVLIRNIERQLPAFYAYLMQYTYNEHKATSVLQSEARSAALEFNTADFITVGRSLIEGNLQYFLDAVRTPKAHEDKQLVLVEYNSLFADIKVGDTSRFYMQDLRTIFSVHCEHVPSAATALGRYLSNAGVALQRDRSGRYFTVTWK